MSCLIESPSRFVMIIKLLDTFTQLEANLISPGCENSLQMSRNIMAFATFQIRIIIMSRADSAIDAMLLLMTSFRIPLVLKWHLYNRFDALANLTAHCK